jgi:coatomer protein complex subunit gamma
LEEDFLVPVTSLSTNEPGTVYVAFKNTSGVPYPTCNFTNILKFTSKEIDPSTGEPDDSGYDDEYQIEDLDLGGSDFVVPAFAGSWEGVWDATSGGDEASETLVLGGIKSIAGMSTCVVTLRCLVLILTRCCHSTHQRLPTPTLGRK